MLTYNNTNDYYSQKINLLKQCLMLSEELVSSLIDWESLDSILSKREMIIEQLVELDKSADKTDIESCSHEKILQIDQLVKLILDFDKDTSKLIEKEQMNIMQSIKSNLLEQKLLLYSKTTDPGAIKNSFSHSG